MFNNFAIAFLMSAVLAVPVMAAPTLNVGSASGQAGSQVDIPITFNPAPDSVASLQFNLTLPTSISTVSVTPGSILTAAGKSVSTNRSGATWTFIVFGLNQDAIAAGTLLTGRIAIAPGTSAGNLSIPISGIVYSDPNGLPVTGGSSTGGTVTVTAPPPTNQAPSVNAGPDQTITLPSTANLGGTASDDGLPTPPGALTTTWSRVSGPGTATFGNANALSTTASFSAAGTYVLRLTASDSALSSSDDLTVIVNATPPPTQPTLAVGTGSGAAGTTVSLPISFTAGNTGVAGMQFNLTLPPSLSTVSVTAGSIVTAAGKSISSNLLGNTWTFIVFGLNQNTIASGSLLTAQLRIAGGTAPGTLAIPISGIVFTDPNGQTVAGGTSTGGSITVTSGGGTAPSITQQPANQVVTTGQTATFTVGANGTAPLTYQWQYALPGSSSFSNIGSNSSSYTTSVTSLGMDGYRYRVVVTNSAGSVTSNAALLTVTSGSPGGLPAPDLSGLPAYAPVNGTLNARYPATIPNITFHWSINRVAASDPTYPTNPRVMARAQSANFQTAGANAALAQYDLEPGYYSIAVFTRDGSGNVSPTVQRNITLVAPDFSGMRVYPNPWRKDRHAAETVTFDRLPLGSTVKIFTVSGHHVKTLTPAPDIAVWDLKNSSGDKVSSGLYIYVVTVGDTGAYDSDGKARGKIVIIR